MVTVPSGGTRKPVCITESNQKRYEDEEKRLSHMYKWLQSGTQALSTIQTDQESDTDDTHWSPNKYNWQKGIQFYCISLNICEDWILILLLFCV